MANTTTARTILDRFNNGFYDDDGTDLYEVCEAAAVNFAYDITLSGCAGRYYRFADGSDIVVLDNFLVTTTEDYRVVATDEQYADLMAAIA